MVCNKEQHGVSVSLDRRIGAQSSRVEGRRKVCKWQYGEKEDTHPPTLCAQGDTGYRQEKSILWKVCGGSSGLREGQGVTQSTVREEFADMEK